MATLRITFQRREPPNSFMEIVEVLRHRQIMNVVENLNALNFDLAETLIHPIHGRVVDGCRTVRGKSGRRGKAVAKRVHSRTRFALLSAGPAAFRAIPLV